MLRIEVYTRADLSSVIESASMTLHRSMSIEEVFREQCPAYDPEKSAGTYVSLYANGTKIPRELWSRYTLTGTERIRIVIEAGGIETSVVMAIISIVLAVASAVYAIIMANRLGKNQQKETRQGSSIYDVNAQGNQVNLTNVVPENFGRFKHYPDYLADKHVFYRNNVQFVDMILCQGRGYYEKAEDRSDVYVGETPIGKLPGCSLYTFEPGEEITAENSPEDRSWYCYYSSTQVTGSGHTLEPEETTVEQSQQRDPTATFNGDTLSGGYYEVGGYNAPGCAGGGGTAYRIYKPLVLPWSDGAFFEISGAVDIRPLGSGDTVTDDPLSGTTEVPVELPEYFNNAQQTLHRAWLRERITETETYIDENDEEQTREVITRAGDAINVTAEARTTITYSIRTGTAGVQTGRLTASNTLTSQCELLGISYGADDSATFTVDTTEIEFPTFPEAPAAPYGAYDITVEQTRAYTIDQPVPADYTWGSDNGLYELMGRSGSVYTVRRVTESYVPVTGWVEFWSQIWNQGGLVFELDENSQAGQYVGPYRACPYGASSSIFEYDIAFPQGLGYLKDDGTFRELTVTIEIGYRLAGSTDPWTTITRDFTASTNDELAYTYTLEVETAGNYEFRMKNLTTADNSTRALNTCKWVGLKSVISTCNRYEGMTVMIGRFKGTETLSELSENRLATYWTRMLPDIVTGELRATRELAPVIKYIVDSSKYQGIINQDSLLEFNDIWNGMELTLDGTIDSDGTLLEVLRDALSVGFSSPIVDDNHLAFTRLHRVSDYEPLAQLFTPQNLTGSPEIIFNLPREDDVDEIVVEYTDPSTYKTETIFCHVDENGDAEITQYPLSNHQEKLKAFGVTNRRQAEAMGMRRLRYLRSTRVTYKISTEMDGLNCQYNDLVGLFLDEDLSSITGRVTAFDYSTSVATVDMEIPESLGAGVIYVRKKDGACMSTTYTREDSHHLTLTDVLPEWDDRYGEDLEYPFFAIGELVKCWVTAVEPQDKAVNLTLINYSPEMFADDLPILRGYGISPYGLAPYGTY